MSTQITYSESDSVGFFPIVLAVVCGVATGVLWAYANPIQLVPGVIQWRIFAFLPPLIGLLLGPKSGFICGYIGTIVWSLLAGTFIPAHSLIVDGIMVGLTGAVPPLLVNLRKTNFDLSMPVLLKIAVICAVVGIIMVAAVVGESRGARHFPVLVCDALYRPVRHRADGDRNAAAGAARRQAACRHQPRHAAPVLTAFGSALDA
ncbi:hypothetical protein [Bradyrhizobium sp. USDA 10063]